MILILKRKNIAAAGVALIFAVGICAAFFAKDSDALTAGGMGETEYIKWVDFDVTAAAMRKALAFDIASYDDGNHNVDWIELLSYLGAKYGGSFKKYKESDLTEAVKRLKDGEKMEDIAAKLKMYDYYLEAYTAVLGGFVGEYEIETENENGEIVWVKKYGLKAFSPIAKGFPYSDFDDFGEGRSYGYKRKHLGHDFMAQVGTPVIAVESGIVEELGWNQYGGWRIGIRSFDTKRYYYYAHLRKNHPYNPNVIKGQTVMAGDVIGYVGRTGYSATENTNNITESHLHFGLQLIFDESQKDGVNQIWIDLYAISNFLSSRRSEGVRDAQTKDYSRKYKMRENTTAADVSAVIPEQVEIPVIMYHDLLKDTKRRGEYTISPSQFEADLKYLSENGYTTITDKELTAFVYDGVPLPSKPVMLTFDDGHYNNIYYGEPLLEKYGMRAILFIVGKFSDASSNEDDKNPNYSYVTWEELRQVAQRGHFEIGNHTWGLHSIKGGDRGILPRRGENRDAYEKRLFEDLTKLQTRVFSITGKPPMAFAYPFGYVSEEASEIIKNAGFNASFCSESGISVVVRGDPESLYDMRRIVRSDKLPVSAILRRNK